MKEIGFLRPVVLVAALVVTMGLSILPVQAQASPSTGVCSTTAPSPFGSNVLMNCDSTVNPHNETAIAVDPNDPSHLIAGSNDFEHTASGTFGFGTNGIG